MKMQYCLNMILIKKRIAMRYSRRRSTAAERARWMNRRTENRNGEMPVL
jgi:hypothetical protein